MIAALQAVRTGCVFRVYNKSNNVLRGPKGVSSVTLWRLDRAGYITDERAERTFRYKQVLTPAGEAALKENSGKPD
jgi:DNA-binding PadR family transcriptional regulator